MVWQSVFNEPWTGTDGDPWDAARWVSKSTPDTSILDIQTNRGRMEASGAAYSHARTTASMTALGTTRVTGTLEFIRTDEQYVVIAVNHDGTWNWNNPENCYWIQFQPGGSEISIQQNNAGTNTQIGWAAFTYAVTTYNYIVERDVGTGDIRVKLWDSGTAEPSGWTATANDALFTSGVVSLRITNGGDGFARRVNWDDLVISEWVEEVSDFALTSPAEGVTVSGTINITSETTDDRVRAMEVYADGSLLGTVFAPVTLTASGPVAATTNGQVIENLDITATGADNGITVSNLQNITIRNCRIRHESGRGIFAEGPEGLRIENCDIECTIAPAAGPLSTDNPVNVYIVGWGSNESVSLEYLTLRRGSTGIECLYVTPTIQKVEGYDFRGPFFRGQLARFDECMNVLMEDFYCETTGDVSWVEDIINAYDSTDPVIRNGLIVGNNSPSGVGVMIENYNWDTSTPSGIGGGGLIENVDMVGFANGAFSAGWGSQNVIIRNCRVREGIAAGTEWHTYLGALWGNTTALAHRDDEPLSAPGQAPFQVGEDAVNARFELCHYYDIVADVYWSGGEINSADFTETDFTPRYAINIIFQWE